MVPAQDCSHAALAAGAGAGSSALNRSAAVGRHEQACTGHAVFLDHEDLRHQAGRDGGERQTKPTAKDGLDFGTMGSSLAPASILPIAIAGSTMRDARMARQRS